jgi:GH43 family beta-xylosidase
MKQIVVVAAVGFIILFVLMSCAGGKTLNQTNKASPLADREGSTETKFVPFNTHFYNPIKADFMLGDPWVIKHDNMYYYCGGNPISVISSPAISGIMARGLNKKKSITVVPPNLTEIWAPELHYYNGYWYIFFAADTNNDNTLHRMYVLRSKTEDPMGDWEYMGKLNLPEDQWAIDGTFFEHNGRIFHIWSGWKDISEGPGVWKQNLYIAELNPENPAQILSTDRVMISTPQYAWETSVLPQNEGPAIVKSPLGTVYCIYSANYSGSNVYALGMLKFAGDDPMDADNWWKFSEPLLASDPAHDIYSPGHCSIAKSPDGTEYWMVYHAAKAQNSGWDRNARAQKLQWVDDKPYMGSPAPLSEPQPLPSGEQVNRILIQAEDMVREDTNTSIINIPGGGKTVHFLSSIDMITAVVNAPNAGFYAVNMRHSNYSGKERTMRLKVNGNLSYTVKASRSGGQQIYTMDARIVSLNKGLNTLTFSTTDYQYVNLDLIVLEKID